MSRVFNRELYNAITNYAEVWGYPKWDNPENIEAYAELVDKCIQAGKIPECNRTEFSTHSRLTAAIAYISNREAFCIGRD